MSDDRQVREAIRQLLAEIQDLKQQPPYGERWGRWYNRVCALLRSRYGLQSAELEGFLAIRFELDAVRQAADENIRQILKPWVSFSPSGVRFAIEHYYNERLSEADEYLLSLIIPAA